MAATEDSPAQPDPTTRQVRDLVAECLEAVEEEGEAAVDRICAEHPELATKIRERLQALVRMGLLSDAEAGEGLPERLGPYRILEEIGRGGMGSVYLAEQREPLRRRVALKVIRLGMDTRDLLARFEVERQALAMMDHPGIARVYDAGATERGRPYFAMEYVPGVAINRYCEQLELGTEQRIELFLLLCDAVQHAHQKGIIHRDLKPTNVLVSSQDQKPLPKIIDFGVAKAMNQRLSEATLYTETGRILGTDRGGLHNPPRSDSIPIPLLSGRLKRQRCWDSPESCESALPGRALCRRGTHTSSPGPRKPLAPVLGSARTGKK